jgi:hypothetical protein
MVGLASVGLTHRPLLADGACPANTRGATAALLLDGRDRHLAHADGIPESEQQEIEVLSAACRGPRANRRRTG